MRPPLKRIFQEKRRLMIPVLGGLALNVLLYVGVVYPLSVRVRSTEARAEAAEQSLRAAERDDAAARGLAEGRDLTDAALKAFYKDVLPSSFADAQQSMILRLSQLAEQHNLQRSRRSAKPEQDRDSSLARLRITMALQGNYEDIRRFVYQLESGTDFIVIDSVALGQGAEPGSPLTLDLMLSTYYRARPDGA
jgi:Tfp pilus assembly protein PilO